MTETILILILVLIFMLVSWFKPDWALMVIAVLLPSYFVRLKIGWLPLTFLEILILALFLVWIISLVLKKLLATVRFPWFLTILLILLVASYSVLVSPDLRSALGLWKAYFLEPIFLYLVAVNVLKTPKQIKSIILALAVSALFISVVAVLQYFGWWPALEPWFSQTPKRVTSIFEFPNAIGLYLSPIIAIFLALLLTKSSKETTKIGYLFYLLVIILGIASLFFSVARGALLGIMVALIFISFFSHYKKWLWLAIIIIIIGGLLVPQTRHQLQGVLSLKDISTDVRVVLWQGTWNLLKAKPLFGAGLAGFPILYEKYRLIKHTEFPLYPHNIFLNFWVELGIVGLGLFITIFVRFFRQGVKKLAQLKNKESSELNRQLIIALMAAFVAIISYGLVDVPYFKNDLSAMFWILVALMNLVPAGQKSGSKIEDSGITPLAHKLLNEACEINRYRNSEIRQGVDGEKEHAKTALNWVEKLTSPSLALRLAALFHDIDGVVTPGVGIGFAGDRKTQAYQEYKKTHAKRSANYICPKLLENGLNLQLVERINFLISHHDDNGEEVETLKDEELNILVSADSLSLFTSIAPKLYAEEGEDGLKDKTRFMINKMPRSARNL